jgi:predicted nuclease of predicted toxin-antitoxin system
MKRVLIDECLDWRLKRLFSEEFVARSVHERGWSGVRNSELLRFAEGQFDVLLTVDKKLPYQQNLARYQLAVVIIEASNNRLATLQAHWSAIEQAVREAQPLTATYVRIERFTE